MSDDGYWTLSNGHFIQWQSADSSLPSVRVRRGRNIRRLTVKMAPGRGVWVNVPYGVSDRVVKDFLETNREWIVTNWEKVREVEVKQQEQQQEQWTLGQEIATRFHRILPREVPGIKASYKIKGEEIALFIPRHVIERDLSGFILSFVNQVYAMECRQWLPGKVEALARQHGFSYGRLSFRNNRSNWGSCSATNNISLNVNLMKFPEPVIDYVILHELCHTVEKNHSDRFWKLMERVCPNYLELRGRLKNVK